MYVKCLTRPAVLHYKSWCLTLQVYKGNRKEKGGDRKEEMEEEMRKRSGGWRKRRKGEKTEKMDGVEEIKRKRNQREGKAGRRQKEGGLQGPFSIILDPNILRTL